MNRVKTCIFIQLCLLIALVFNVNAKTSRVEYSNMLDYYETTKAGFNGPFFIIDKSFVQASDKMKISLGIMNQDYYENQNVYASVSDNIVIYNLFDDRSFLEVMDATILQPTEIETKYDKQFNYFKELETQIRSPD